MLADIAVIIGVIGFSVVVIHREFFGERPQKLGAKQAVINWQRYAVGSRIGPPKTPVTITEFFDYQCPFCLRSERTLAAMRSKYHNQVAIVYDHFPLESHQYSFAAAVASSCADRQGRFPQFHAKLWERQKDIGKVSWESFAIEAGVPDLEQFATCVRDTVPRNTIQKSLDAAKSLKINGTPTLLVNGRMLVGLTSQEELERYIQEELNTVETNKSFLLELWRKLSFATQERG